MFKTCLRVRSSTRKLLDHAFRVKAEQSPASLSGVKEDCAAFFAIYKNQLRLSSETCFHKEGQGRHDADCPMLLKKDSCAGIRGLDAY